MMIKPSDEYLKKYDKVREWVIYDKESGNLILDPNAPNEIKQLNKWLDDNDPAKGIELY